MNSKKIREMSLENRLNYITAWKDMRMKPSVFVSMKVEDVEWMIKTIYEFNIKEDER